MREHSLHICKMLGICCARLSRRVPSTAGRRAEEGVAVRGSRGGAREAALAARSAVCLYVAEFSVSRDQVWAVT